MKHDANQKENLSLYQNELDQLNDLHDRSHSHMTPENYITLSVNADKLLNYYGYNDSMLGSAITKVLARAIQHVDSDPKNVIYINRHGEIDVHPTHLEYYDELNTSPAKRLSEINIKPQNVPYAIVGDLYEHIDDAMKVMPKKSVVALTFSKHINSSGQYSQSSDESVASESDGSSEVNMDRKQNSEPNMITLSLAYDQNNLKEEKALKMVQYMSDMLEDSASYEI